MTKKFHEQIQKEDKEYSLKRIERIIENLNPDFSKNEYRVWTPETFSKEVERRKNIIKEFLQEIINEIGPITDISIGGSTAIGNFYSESDIDLAISFDTDYYIESSKDSNIKKLKPEIQTKIDNIKNKIKEKYGLSIDLLI